MAMTMMECARQTAGMARRDKQIAIANCIRSIGSQQRIRSEPTEFWAQQQPIQHQQRTQHPKTQAQVQTSDTRVFADLEPLPVAGRDRIEKIRECAKQTSGLTGRNKIIAMTTCIRLAQVPS